MATPKMPGEAENPVVFAERSEAKAGKTSKTSLSVVRSPLRALVTCGRQSVSGRRFTADTSFVDVGNSDSIAGTEYVYDPNTSEGFQRGQDYEIDTRNGEIRTTSSGTMMDKATYAIDYEYKLRGRHGFDESSRV